MRPVDRRGLGEIVAWATVVACTAGVAVAAIVVRDPSAAYAVALFGGAVAALLGRGTKGAIDRDASAELAEANRNRPMIYVQRKGRDTDG